jgi:replicative DNA helicase
VCALPVSPQPRVPPHDLEAETSVLGAILLDPAAITRVLDLLSPDDFYRENNGQIYRAAQNLFREGEPIDNVTLAAELAKLGVLERVGGRAHLALLQESVPTAANVEHYARIVKGRAYKRRLIGAGTQVTALGYDESLDADEAVNQAQANVYAISDDRMGSGMEHIYNLLKPAMDRIDAQMASGGGVIGIPSGFHDLDRMTNGFKAADLVIIAGRPSMGKALALDTPIPTPNGWTTMGALRTGDRVFDDRGRPCTVTYATPVMLGHPCHELLFSDGEAIVADADHLWAVADEGGERPRVLTTRQVAAALAAGTALSVPTCGPLHYRRRDLPMDPRELGVRLVAPVPAAAGRPGTAVAERVHAVPRAYLEAAVDQRLALLQGLMCAAGPADADDRVEFRSASPDLAAAVAELAVGLGLAVRSSPGRVEFRTVLPSEWASRSIQAVVPVQSVPVRCIQVDSPAHLYLAGRGCVPTHNTSFVLNVTLHAAVEHKKPVAIFSLEMSKEQLVERMLCEQARIDAQRLHRGTLSDIEYERLAGALGPLGDAPIFIDDSPMLDDLTMRLKARQGRSREGIELIVLDYLQLMHGRQGGDANRVQEVSAISRALKSIARELRIPVIAISQLSRAPEARPDKRPILSDLRESGSIEQDADIVMFLYRDDYYNREKSEKPGIAEIILAKHRNGPTGAVELMFRKELTRFENLERRRPESTQ